MHSGLKYRLEEAKKWEELRIDELKLDEYKFRLILSSMMDG